VRVVSLVPSMTETLLAWGIRPIACTRFCEQPDIREVGGTKTPDIDRIRSLDPDLVIVDTEENRLEDHDALVAAHVPVHLLSIRSIDDVSAQLVPLAERVGAEWTPIETVPRPISLSAFVPIWRRPWMALGAPTYGSSLLRVLGVENVFAGDGPYPTVTLDEAAARGPAVVLAPDEPYPFRERHRDELSPVAPPIFVDGRDLFWWGSRTQHALERLSAALGLDRAP
jgi:ABC-type Fe3+-hydroxamate transport system substrate-binding protein